MTVASFGRITPLQGDMLTLAGYGPSERDGTRDLEIPTDWNKRLENIRKGRELLSGKTQKDLGFSLRKWHDFLLASEEFKKRYTHPYGWRAVQGAVIAELQNPDRARLEALAEE